jgi:hypothetical protein
MFVDEVFSKTTLFLEFVKHLRISLTLNDNLQTLQSFLTSKCSLCKVKTVATEFEKRKANNLFFWVGRYPTNLTYDNGKKSIKIYITNAAESINGKVTDRSVFINGTPVYNVTFKDRRMTWDYDTDSLQPNQSKGDIVFMGVFANVYIGCKFSGTLEIKSNIHLCFYQIRLCLCRSHLCFYQIRLCLCRIRLCFTFAYIANIKRQSSNASKLLNQ